MIISKTRIDERASEREQLRQIRSALYILCEEVEAALEELYSSVSAEGPRSLGGETYEKGRKA